MVPSQALNSLDKALKENHLTQIQKALKQLYTFNPNLLFEAQTAQQLDDVLKHNIASLNSKKWLKVLDFFNRSDRTSYDKFTDHMLQKWIQYYPTAIAVVAGVIDHQPTTALEHSNRKIAVALVEKAVLRNDEEFCNKVLSALKNSTPNIENEFTLLSINPRNFDNSSALWIYRLFPLYAINQLKSVAEECAHWVELQKLCDTLITKSGSVPSAAQGGTSPSPTTTLNISFVATLFNTTISTDHKKRTETVIRTLIMPLSNHQKREIVDMLDEKALYLLKTHNELFNAMHQQLLFTESVQSNEISLETSSKRKM